MLRSMARPPYVDFPVRLGGRRASAGDIVSAVIAEVRAGRLPAGARLPPVRVLEGRLGLSKNTASAAYDELCARGVLVSREREGVFVAGPEEGVERTSAIAAPPLPLLRPAPAIGAPSLPRGVISLSTVFIDPELLPRERLAECARSVLRTPGLAHGYDGQGLPILRELIAKRLCARGIECEPEHVIVTTGSQQALDLIARATEVRRVAVETPVYSYARMLFASLGLGVTGLRLDPFEGPDLARWERELARTRPGFLYAITSFQNPTGYSYSTHELERLLELSRKYDFALVEDDWGSDMLSGGEHRPMLRMLGGPNVLYVNSFTKKLLPSLRIGFLVAHPSLVPTLLAHKRMSTLGNAWLTEAVVAEFLDRGYYDTHLASLQRELDARYAACLDSLADTMPEGVRWTRPGGGPTLWLEVPRDVDLEALRARCEARGVRVESTEAHFEGEPHLFGFRISYAWSPPEVLRKGLAILAEEIAR